MSESDKTIINDYYTPKRQGIEIAIYITFAIITSVILGMYESKDGPKDASITSFLSTMLSWFVIGSFIKSYYLYKYDKNNTYD